MSEIISCPSCHRKLQVPESLLGQDVQCPTCGATFVGAFQSQGPSPALRSQSSAPATGPRPRIGGYDDRPAHREDYDDHGEDRSYRGRRRDLRPHRGAAVLTLGILSLIPCVITAVILGLIAWIMGQTDLSEIRAGRMDPDGEGMTNAGRICGIIGTCLYGALFALWLLGAMVAAGSGF